MQAEARPQRAEAEPANARHSARITSLPSWAPIALCLFLAVVGLVLGLLTLLVAKWIG